MIFKELDTKKLGAAVDIMEISSMRDYDGTLWIDQLNISISNLDIDDHHLRIRDESSTYYDGQLTCPRNWAIL